MSELKQGKLFLKEVVARIKGDDAEVLGAKIARKAVSAVDGQIAALKGRKVDVEGEVEDAKEALATAKFPVVMITDNRAYIEGIKKAQEAYDKKVQDLSDVEDSLKFFDALLTTF